jgi:hypothetical protein
MNGLKLYQMKVMIKIWDVVKEEYWLDEDGEPFLYDNETAARNALFTEGYKQEYAETGVEYHPHVIVE